MKPSIHITMANCPAVRAVKKMVCIAFEFCAVTAIPSAAQTFTTLANFNGTDGQFPTLMSLVQGPDGNFYGTTTTGGLTFDPSCCGTVFKLSLSAVASRNRLVQVTSE